MNIRNVKLTMLFVFVMPIWLAAQNMADSIMRSENLIMNGDFMSRDPEQRPLHWIVGKGLQTASISSQQKHAPYPDDLSLKVTDTSSFADLLVRSGKRIANPGTLYRASAWFKSEIGTPSVFLIEFWDQNNKRISYKELRAQFSKEWQQLGGELQAPDKSTHVTVAIHSREKDTGVSFWDDVSLVYEYSYNFELDGKRELFLDDYRIETFVDVARIVHPGKKSKPLIVPTKPWEGTAVYIYGTVLVDQPKGSGYRMWYTAYADATYYLCYATSKDGISWEKPDLGIIDYKGSKKNNICKVGGGTLIYDPDDKDPARRYKMMDVVQADTARKRPFGYGVLFSSDGLRWNQFEGNPVLPYADVSQVAYDEGKRIFIAATKQRMLVSNTSVTINKMDRAAFISTSTDFTTWTAPGAAGSLWTLAVEGDHIADQIVRSKGGLEAQIYGMSLFPYEGLCVGMPWAFDVSGYNQGAFAPYGAGDIQPEIAVSRDLRHWSRPTRDPVLPLGIKGSWDDGAIYSSSKLVLTSNDVQLYYGGMNMDHGGTVGDRVQVAKIAKATWRRDGFVSLSNGGNDVGIITTKELVFEGDRLMVNTNIQSSGNLKIEILDSGGTPIPGYTLMDAKAISGDQLSATALWKGQSDLSKLAGRKVRLRFHLLGGDLFSYWFTK